MSLLPAGRLYQSDDCWVDAHGDCRDEVCLCDCHARQVWDPWDETWRSPAAGEEGSRG